MALREVVELALKLIWIFNFPFRDVWSMYIHDRGRLNDNYMVL